MRSLTVLTCLVILLAVFYLFPDVTEAMDRMGYTAVGDFAAVALHQTGVSFCTREHFGRRQPGEERQYIRLAYSGIEVADIREELGITPVPADGQWADTNRLCEDQPANDDAAMAVAAE